MSLSASRQAFGDVPEGDFYTFSIRYEAIEQGYVGLLNDPAQVRPQG